MSEELKATNWPNPERPGAPPMSRAMRTREEQIEVETDIISRVVNKHIDRETCKSFVHRLVMEAERRAEQRVRAEIGRDSERLDWLEKTRSVVLEDANNGWRVTIGRVEFSLMEETARNAIDAARENAND